MIDFGELPVEMPAQPLHVVHFQLGLPHDVLVMLDGGHAPVQLIGADGVVQRLNPFRNRRLSERAFLSEHQAGDALIVEHVQQPLEGSRSARRSAGRTVDDDDRRAKVGQALQAVLAGHGDVGLEFFPLEQARQSFGDLMGFTNNEKSGDRAHHDSSRAGRSRQPGPTLLSEQPVSELRT